MRSIWRKSVVVGGGVLGVLGLIALVRREPPIAPLGRVALIGDSYAVGLGPELAKIFPSFRYEGHVGVSTVGWARSTKYGDWLAAFNPDVVLVSLGVNDGSLPMLLNYQEIVRNIHGIGARVVWIEPPAGVQTKSRAVISSLGVQTVPATTTPLSADGLHPQSYAPWALEIARSIA